jgi:hypothetical protein
MISIVQYTTNVNQTMTTTSLVSKGFGAWRAVAHPPPPIQISCLPSALATRTRTQKPGAGWTPTPTHAKELQNEGRSAADSLAGETETESEVVMHRTFDAGYSLIVRLFPSLAAGLWDAGCTTRLR